MANGRELQTESLHRCHLRLTEEDWIDVLHEEDFVGTATRSRSEWHGYFTGTRAFDSSVQLTITCRLATCRAVSDLGLFHHHSGFVPSRPIKRSCLSSGGKVQRAIIRRPDVTYAAFFTCPMS
jgi:hypothetical protein